MVVILSWSLGLSYFGMVTIERFISFCDVGSVWLKVGKLGDLIYDKYSDH